MTWLKRMRELRLQRGEWQPRRPLFVVDGAAVTISAMQHYVKWCMALMGENPSQYSGHSLRIGGATAAFAAGVDETTIRALGRWDSETYRLYTRMSRQAAMRLGAAVASTAFDARG